MIDWDAQVNEFNVYMSQDAKLQNISSHYERSKYEDKGRLREHRDETFGGKKTITDSVTGERLHKSTQMAKNKYGTGMDKSGRSVYNKHTAQTDHVVPLKNIHERHKDDWFLRDEDIRAAANRDWNLREISGRFNQSKGAKTNLDMAAESVQKGEYKQAAILSKDHAVSTSAMEAELAVVKTYRAGEYAARNVYQTGKAIIEEGTRIKNEAMQSIGKTAGKSVAVGAEAALITATVSGISNIVSVAQGKKTLKEAAIDTAKSGGSAFVVGTAMDVAKDGAAKLAGRAMGKAAGARLIGNANIAVNAAVAVVTVGDAVFRYLDGEISADECVVEMAMSGTVCVMAWACGMTMGPLGAAVASAVLGMIQSAALQWYYGCKADRKRYEQGKIAFRNLFRAAEAALAAQSRWLDEMLSAEEQARRVHFDAGLSQMLVAASGNDTAGIVAGLDTILGYFGEECRFHTLEEFNEFFDDEDAVFRL